MNPEYGHDPQMQKTAAPMMKIRGATVFNLFAYPLIHFLPLRKFKCDHQHAFSYAHASRKLCKFIA